MNNFLDCEFTGKKNIVIVGHLILFHEIDFYRLAFLSADIHDSPKNVNKL